MTLRLVCHDLWAGNRLIDSPVEMPGLAGHIYSRPCDGGRGGDVHSLTTCGSGLFSRMMIADVAGHGEAVAAISSAVGRVMKRYMNWPDQRSVLRRLNVELAEMGLDALTTAVVVSYYPPRRWLSLSYAGHHPAWHYRKRKDDWRRLDISRSTPEHPLKNLPLAADPRTQYTRRSMRVELGDRLLLVTDGVLEALDDQEQSFSAAGVNRLLQSLRHEPIPQIAKGLLDAMQAHCGQRDLDHDDVTFALVEFVPGPPGSTLRNVVMNRILRPRGNSAELQARAASAPGT